MFEHGMQNYLSLTPPNKRPQVLTAFHYFLQNQEKNTQQQKAMNFIQRTLQSSKVKILTIHPKKSVDISQNQLLIRSQIKRTCFAETGAHLIDSLRYEKEPRDGFVSSSGIHYSFLEKVSRIHQGLEENTRYKKIKNIEECPTDIFAGGSICPDIEMFSRYGICSRRFDEKRKMNSLTNSLELMKTLGKSLSKLGMPLDNYEVKKALIDTLHEPISKTKIFRGRAGARDRGRVI